MTTTPIKLTISGGAPVEVEAEIYGDFGIHEGHKDPGWWIVTHVPTGLGCTGGLCLGLLAARELAERYAKLEIPADASAEQLAVLLKAEFFAFRKWAGLS